MQANPSITMNDASKPVVYSMWAFVGIGVLLMVTSLLSLMIFSAEANEIQSFEDGTFSPEIDNEGYRIYSTAESCEDVTLSITTNPPQKFYAGYDTEFYSGCEKFLRGLFWDSGNHVFIGEISGTHDDCEGMCELKSSIIINASAEISIVSREPIESAKDNLTLGFIFSMIGAGIFIYSLINQRERVVLNPNLGFSLDEQMKSHNLTDGLRCLFKLEAYMKSNNLSVEKIFSDFDLNDDGNIDKEEFKLGLKEIGIEDLSQNEIDEVMSFLDTDNNGTVDFEEFKFYFAK